MYIKNLKIQKFEHHIIAIFIQIRFCFLFSFIINLQISKHLFNYSNIKMIFQNIIDYFFDDFDFTFAFFAFFFFSTFRRSDFFFVETIFLNLFFFFFLVRWEYTSTFSSQSRRCFRTWIRYKHRKHWNENWNKWSWLKNEFRIHDYKFDTQWNRKIKKIHHAFDQQWKNCYVDQFEFWNRWRSHCKWNIA